MNNEPGIYRIVNTVTNRTYIGSSSNIRKRLNTHKCKLMSGVHTNQHLQQSWRKYGSTAFTFEPMLDCVREAMVVKEQQFIDAYLDHDLPLYNQKPSAKSRTGFSLTKEIRDKISAGNKGKTRTAETRQRMSIAVRNRLPEITKKLMQANIGRIFSSEARDKIRKSKIGNQYRRGATVPQEMRARISLALKGRKLSVEHRANIKDAVTQEARIVRSEKMTGNQHHLGHIHSDEARGKMRLAWIRRKVRKELLS